VTCRPRHLGVASAHHDHARGHSIRAHGDRFGLVASMLASMTLAALGTPEDTLREYVFFARDHAAIGVGTFISLLASDQVLP